MKLFSRVVGQVLGFLAFYALTVQPALAQSNAQDYIVLFGGFLSNIFLPFLFSLAFLFFLYNIARYFIFGGANEDDRKKAKRAAIYGVAAFVFLVIIWSIVNLLLSGLGLAQRTTICTDYFSNFGEPCGVRTGGSGGAGGSIIPGTGSSGGGTGATGGGTGSTGGTTGGSTGGTGGGTGSGSGTGGTIPGGGTPPATVTAPLAELIFGTGRDGAGYHRSLTLSAALSSTPTILATETCENGVNTLLLASRTEPAQAAYLYYRTSGGAMRWQNITDRHTANYIGYDRDVIDDIVAAGGTNLHIVHTHPLARPRALGLTMVSHGPSAADWQAMCVINNPAITYVTVSGRSVWSSQQTNTTCPYTNAAMAALPTIETYTALAMLEASRRSEELLKYVNNSLVPSTQKNVFSVITPSSLANLNTEQVLTYSNEMQTFATTSVQHFSTGADFCASR